MFAPSVCGFCAGRFFHYPVYQHGKYKHWPLLTRPLTQISTANTVWSGSGSPGHTRRSTLSPPSCHTDRRHPYSLTALNVCVWGNKRVNVCLWELGHVSKRLPERLFMCAHAPLNTYVSLPICCCDVFSLTCVCCIPPIFPYITALTETSVFVFYSHPGYEVNKGCKRKKPCFSFMGHNFSLT